MGSGATTVQYPVDLEKQELVVGGHLMSTGFGRFFESGVSNDLFMDHLSGHHWLDRAPLFFCGHQSTHHDACKACKGRGFSSSQFEVPRKVT